jgi:hypothetical protein
VVRLVVDVAVLFLSSIHASWNTPCADRHGDTECGILSWPPLCTPRERTMGAFEALLQAHAIGRKPDFDPATTERRFVVCASDYVTTVLLAN